MKELEQFENFMLNHGKSVTTVKGTVSDVKEFMRIMEIESIEDIDALKPLDIEDYLSAIRENGCSDNTRKTKAARIRVFFNFLFDKELISRNIMRGITIKAGNAEIVEFSRNDIVKLLNNANSLRDYTMIYTLFGTGMRVSEMVGLKTKNVLADGRIQVLGKGNKFRVIHCAKEVCEKIFEYVKATENERKESPYVFVTSNAKQVDKRNIDAMLKNLAKQCNLDHCEHFSAHKIRHTYARYALNVLHIPLDVISKNLGHSDVAITSKVYATTNEERVREYIDTIDAGRMFGRKDREFDE